MLYNELITETGFLTLKGSEEMSKTMVPGIEGFLKNFDGELGYDELLTLKSVMSKTLSDLMSEKLKAAPNTVNARYIDGEAIKNGSPIPGGGFIKIGTN